MPPKIKANPKRFERSVVFAPKPSSPDSPLAHIDKILGRRISLKLIDARTLEGRLVAFDWAGYFFMYKVDEIIDDNIFELEKVICPISYITEMSVLTPSKTNPAAPAQK
jgi:small nuclear ribonucleoprotein (snRNP)-like protein